MSALLQIIGLIISMYIISILVAKIATWIGMFGEWLSSINNIILISTIKAITFQFGNTPKESNKHHAQSKGNKDNKGIKKELSNSSPKSQKSNLEILQGVITLATSTDKELDQKAEEFAKNNEEQSQRNRDQSNGSDTDKILKRLNQLENRVNSINKSNQFLQNKINPQSNNGQQRF